MNYKIKEDIKLIRTFYNYSQEQLAKELSVERVRIARIEIGQTIPRNDFLETFYNYCFNKGLKLNLQKEMFYRDDIQTNHLLLTHASKDEIIGNIQLSYSQEHNDFGKAFYCSDSYDKSASFICHSIKSSIYFIDFNPVGLKKIIFGVDQDWMLSIAYFRGRLEKYKNCEIIQKLVNKIKKADYIIAPIADNRMFEIIDSFISGYITDEQCKHCLAATNLGLQYVFLTEKAIENLTILERCYISSAEKDIYKKNQIEFQKQGIDKTKLARIQYKNKGKYIEELLK